MRLSIRSVAAMAAAAVAALLALFAAGADSIPMVPVYAHPLGPRSTCAATGSPFDFKKASSALEAASVHWSKALKDVNSAKLWNLTAAYRAAAKKIAGTFSSVEEVTSLKIMLVVGTSSLAALLGSGPGALVARGVLGSALQEAWLVEWAGYPKPKPKRPTVFEEWLGEWARYNL
ncbi:hypothetical protein B0T26DRAFT_669477 [Lasiosphaeria miniovina]|uniref:Uncharacterized protein n=1 Tax=Lasiosphaeria miniovina TaxID=1954250 RepID=A0AA40BEY8_9PEZI|nr:uncharacterized protein B0T26DRAFT_669477 [Lasiosphaeria miniovina]KAK0733021.1 hypothetical protein B0T26DRAFT_669477 [Lasiosphaeria miniovina]